MANDEMFRISTLNCLYVRQVSTAEDYLTENNKDNVICAFMHEKTWVPDWNLFIYSFLWFPFFCLLWRHKSYFCKLRHNDTLVFQMCPAILFLSIFLAITPAYLFTDLTFLMKLFLVSRVINHILPVYFGQYEKLIISSLIS